MNRLKSFVILSATVTMTLSSCNPDNIPNDNNPDALKYKDLGHTAYTESEKAFPNPERGFYFVNDFHSPSDSPVSINGLISNRKLKRTVAYHGYYLTDYIESDIASDFLDLMRQNMENLRKGGVKCVLRFAYTDEEPTLTDKVSDDFKGRDASPEWVARHIEQVKPILQEYGDVIMCFQAGFVGVWGEWYYTDHFVSGPQTPEEHALRKQVVDAMLDALPVDRQVALRTPMFTRMMYASDYTDTLTIATAHNGSPRSRLAAFNDCFGASQNDQGTFDGSASRGLWKNDTKYVFMGGETCAISNFCKCEASLKDMEDYHWTYLNCEYNTKVLKRWRTDGCMEDIERRLGYRLALTDVYQSPAAVAGDDFRVVLKIKNSGFSAPINPRGCELVLIDGNGKKTVYDQTEIDPRYRFAGETFTLDTTIKIPAEAIGDCVLYLNLPDPKETLHDNPLFSIRLANDDIWDEETGFNKVTEFTL